MRDYSMEELAKLLTMSQVAELKNVPVGVVRRAARSEAGIPGKVEVLGRFGFDPVLVATWEPPAGSARTVREDGRKKYWVFANTEEHADLVELGYEVVDPSIAAKARRTARKAAKAAKVGAVPTEAEGTETESEDPFADFKG